MYFTYFLIKKDELGWTPLKLPKILASDSDEFVQKAVG